MRYLQQSKSKNAFAVVKEGEKATHFENEDGEVCPISELTEQTPGLEVNSKGDFIVQQQPEETPLIMPSTANEEKKAAETKVKANESGEQPLSAPKVVAA